MDDETFLALLRGENPKEYNLDPTPPPQSNLGFAPYASTPHGVMGFSPADYQDDSLPVFAQFQTPPSKGSRGATQELEGLNLSSSFESVSNVPTLPKKKGKDKSTPAQAAPESTKRTKAVPYSPEESAHLIKVWSSISEDPAVGNRQKKKILWGNIVARYNAMIGNIGYNPRNVKQLKGHWQRIMPKCNLFHGYCVQANRDWKSGNDAHDVYKDADALYTKATGKPFQYKAAHDQLKLLPKYTDFYCNKKQKGTDGSSNSSDPDAVEAEEDGYFPECSRPIRTKQAKAQTRNKGKRPKLRGAVVNPEYPKESMVILPVQINGKTRGTIQVEKQCTEDYAFELASLGPKLSKFLEGKAIKKRIFIQSVKVAP